MMVASFAPVSIASPSAGSVLAPASDFEARRAYVLQRLDDAGAMFRRSMELLTEPIAGGPVPPGSDRARQLDGIVAASMGAAIAVQEAMLWYGDIRAGATLPTEFAARERPVIAHVMTAVQGVTRTEGFVRAMLELGQAPLDEGTWREQGRADAHDGALYATELAAVVAALRPRA